MHVKPDRELQHFIFIANSVAVSDMKVVSPARIAERLFQAAFWAFTEGAPLRAKLAPGDRVLIYLAGSAHREFVAKAIVKSEAAPLTEYQERVLGEIGIPFFYYGVVLENIQVFPEPVKIRPLVDRLSFIKEKKNYGLHLRLPIVRISDEDYTLLTTRVHDDSLQQ